MPGISKKSQGWRGHEPFPAGYGLNSAKRRAKEKMLRLREIKREEKKREKERQTAELAKRRKRLAASFARTAK